MNPIFLQKQLRENSKDLDDFCKDLKAWGDQMKNKDKKSEHVIDTKKNKSYVDSSTRESNVLISRKNVTDYSAWEKFDADAECEKVDKDDADESELSDECDQTLKDEAYAEKEKGNLYVKSKQWEKAIVCYSKAINKFAYDPIFYANRALCYLKINENLKAEADCTLSLKLDKTYVKAYQRRASARKLLNKLEEAQCDLFQVLELEPKNKESQKELENLKAVMFDMNVHTEKKTATQRPISKFTASRNQKKVISSHQNFKETPSQTGMIENIWTNYGEIIPVRVVDKPVNLRSKKPLKRIAIIEEKDDNFGSLTESNALPRANKLSHIVRTDDLKVIERHKIIDDRSKKEKNEVNLSCTKTEENQLVSPSNSVQFYSQWRLLSSIAKKSALLKLIQPEKLEQIFGESMEPKMFSQILEVLSSNFIQNNEKVFDYLTFLTKVKRFSTILMFMNDTDKLYLHRLFEYMLKHDEKPKEAIRSLQEDYQLTL